MLSTRNLAKRYHGAALLMVAETILLSGCALSGPGTTSPVASRPSVTHLVGGTIHGGQQPVIGATVILWAAGTTGTGAVGYGTGATQVGASTTTDSNGNFTFDNALGVSPCTTGQYLYITATAGNPGAGTNNYAAFMTAIPTPCGSSTGATYVTMNEVTTVAAVTALQQFMSINTSATAPYKGTGTVPWTIGAPSTNVTGLANAFTQVGNIVNIGTGVSAATSSSGSAGTVGFTNVITPSSAKINLLGDILAYCVNSSGTVCSSLFSDTTPSGKTTPVDTIQAMYYLATSPAGLTMPAHGTAGSPYYLCTNYASPTGPFQPTQPCTSTQYPVDWTVSVTWGASGNTTGTVQAGNVAIDGFGNIWTAQNNSTSTGGYIVELNQAGTVLQAPVTATTSISLTSGYNAASYNGSQAYTLGGAKVNSLAIDTNNNAWYTGFYTASTTVGTTAAESPIAEIAPAPNTAGTVTGYLTGSSQAALAIDGSNNIYFGDQPNGSTVRYYISSLTGSPYTYSEGIGRQANDYNLYSAVNQAVSSSVNPNSTTSYAWIMNEVCETIPRTDAAIQTAAGTPATVSISTTAPVNCVNWGATDAIGNLWGGYGYLEYVNITNASTGLSAPVVTQYASGTSGTGGIGGLYNANGVAVDGAGNVWVANGAGGTLGGVSEFTPSNSGTTLTALSPAGANIFGFLNAGYGGTPFIQAPTCIAIDSSGNVWIGTSAGSYLNYIVGAAAPVTTPYATQIKNTAVGIRP